MFSVALVCSQRGCLAHVLACAARWRVCLVVAMQERSLTVVHEARDSTKYITEIKW